ncbi:MAG: malto-oligosyltrehalose trehalohydrolase [Candidatus Velthaea sp.]
MHDRYTFGATRDADGVGFRLYAPAAHGVSLEYDGKERELAAAGGGWFALHAPDAARGTRYRFRIDGGDLRVPDPASRFQPDGVHGESEVVDPAAFEWHDDAWLGRPWNEMVFYELHLGAFTPEGTYAAAAERLDDLVDLGVSAIELMPLAQAPGARNWGYDGVLPYAPSNNYGRPEDLVRLIDAAHARGLAVFLDVVYNHFGPEGNYLHALAPAFFTDRYATPWGAAIDFSADPARSFFIENARYWLEFYHIDGLRLDATQMIFDARTPSMLEELQSSIAAWTPPGRQVHLVVENDRNDARLLRAGYDAQWNDDFHHAAHVCASGERDGYYGDYAARPAWFLGRTLTEGYGYQGEPSAYHRGEARGMPSGELPLAAFVNFIQNHDQIGNRALGERLNAIAPLEAVRAAAAVMLLAPSPPLLFMGEEWAASTPFLFFCDFEPELAKLVTEGRRREFAAFGQFGGAGGLAQIPDPSARETFARSVLRWDERNDGIHKSMLDHYRALLRLRAAEIAPRASGVRVRDARYVLAGERGVRATWQLAGGVLRADINLSAHACPGFTETPPGRTLFASHAERYANGVAPAWSVRWTLA